MTCTGCGVEITSETRYKDRLLCKSCYPKWWKNYCAKKYPKGTIAQRVMFFNRNRAGAHLKESDLESIILRQLRQCKTCNDDLANVAWEIDHIVPVSVGGNHNPSNLQILCKRCNRAKDNGSMGIFMAWVDRIVKSRINDIEKKRERI